MGSELFNPELEKCINTWRESKDKEICLAQVNLQTSSSTTSSVLVTEEEEPTPGDEPMTSLKDSPEEEMKQVEEDSSSLDDYFKPSQSVQPNVPKKEPVPSSSVGAYQLNIDSIITGKDLRTTLMVKNIPNKYT